MLPRMGIQSVSLFVMHYLLFICDRQQTMFVQQSYLPNMATLFFPPPPTMLVTKTTAQWHCQQQPTHTTHRQRQATAKMTAYKWKCPWIQMTTCKWKQLPTNANNHLWKEMAAHQWNWLPTSWNPGATSPMVMWPPNDEWWMLFIVDFRTQGKSPLSHMPPNQSCWVAGQQHEKEDRQRQQQDAQQLQHKWWWVPFTLTHKPQCMQTITSQNCYHSSWTTASTHEWTWVTLSPGPSLHTTLSPSIPPL